MSTFTDIPDGHIAAVVTHLEMFERPAPRQCAKIDAVLERVDRPDPQRYRDLFMDVGGRDWMWFSRMAMSDEELCGHIHDPANHIYILRGSGRDIGLLELDFRKMPDCELGYFGLTAGVIGTGAGRWMMEEALERAWAMPITRFHVHTCTLDAPQALPFYMRSGFTAYRREIETVPDPRLHGILPRTAAPDLPIITVASSQLG